MKSAKIIIMLILVAALSSCSSEGLHFEFTIDDVSKIFSNKSAEASNSSETITIASFNIQIFGKTNAKKPEVMKVLAKTIAQYEIVAIQEIRDKPETAIKKLEKEVDADKAGVYRFDETHSLTAKEAKKVSDHYPVWATFYTGKDTD